jgi:hypothetical protein
MKNLIKKILREEFDDFDWVGEIKEFSPAEEFLYEIMSNLTMIPSENYPGWMLYKDEIGRILMADDIDLNDGAPSLLISYHGIFKILRNKFKLEYGEMVKSSKKIFNLVHKRQVDAVGALYNLHLSQF